MYQVLARKWRPQGFDGLVGQTHISRTLSNAVASNRLAHAYLFAGLRGTGKTTVARILAKCLNCEKGPTSEPCNQCVACVEITESRAIDVLEVDAASRTKVDQTRELLEMVSYAPVRDRNKILIIDEAHMLSKASFNALLKTLEEPPPNVLFILATTEIQKIIPTILSRCQVFEFRRVPAREVAGYLRTLCNSESIEISDASLDRIARTGEGSVRDSLSVLERVLAFCGDKIDDEEVLRVLGAVRAEVLIGTLRGLAARDAGAMLEVLDSLVDEGHDLIHFWSELIASLRDLLFRDAVPGRDELLSRPPEEAHALAEAAEGLSRQDLLRAFQVLADLEPALRSSSHPKFMFEAALIRLAELGDVRPIEEMLAALESGTLVGGAPGGPAEKKSLADVRRGSGRRAAPPVKPAPPRGKPRPESASPAPRPSAPAPVERPAIAPASAPSGGPGSPAGFEDRVRTAKPMIGAMIEQAASVTHESGELVMTFDPENDALVKSLERKETLAFLEEQATEEFGHDVRLKVGVHEAPTEQAAGSPRKTSTSRRPPRKGSAAEGKQLLEEATKEPGVKKLLREFGAQVIEVSPLDHRAPDESNLEEF